MAEYNITAEWKEGIAARQITINKLQIPNQLQTPLSKSQMFYNDIGHLAIEHYLEFVI